MARFARNVVEWDFLRDFENTVYFLLHGKKLLENEDDVRNKTVKVQKSIAAVESRFASAFAAAALPYIFYNNYLKRTKSAKISLETDPKLICL